MSAAAAVAAALGSATCFGLASAEQFAAVRQTTSRGALDARLLLDLARLGRWWWAAAAEVVAVALQYVALRNGSVALVQALIVLGLPIAVLIASPHRLARTPLLGLVLTTGGIFGFAVLQPVAAAGRASSQGLIAPCVLAALVALLARYTGPVLTGAAAGVLTGCAGVLLAAVAAEPLHRLLLGPALYATAVVGLLALQVAQAALRAPHVGPPLAALTLLEPVTAVVLAAIALDQRPALPVAAVLSAVVAAVGVLTLQLSLAT